MPSAADPASTQRPPARSPWPLWLAVFAGWTGLGLAGAAAAQIYCLLIIIFYLGSLFDEASLGIMGFMVLWWLLLFPAVLGLIKLFKRDARALFWLKIYVLTSFLITEAINLNIALKSGMSIIYSGSVSGLFAELLSELQHHLLSIPRAHLILPFMAATYLISFLYLKKSPAVDRFFEPPDSPSPAAPLPHGLGLTAWFMIYTALYYFDTLIFVFAMGLSELFPAAPLRSWGEFFILAARALGQSSTWNFYLKEFSEIIILFPALIILSLTVLIGLNRRRPPALIIVRAALAGMIAVWGYWLNPFWLIPTAAAIVNTFISPAFKAAFRPHELNTVDAPATEA